MPQSIDVTIDADGYHADHQDKKSLRVPILEYHMLDKRKYFPLVALSGICIRSVLYPFSVIKTRLQIQRSRSLYRGTFDAFVKIIRHEGVRGLYSGFLVHNLSIFSQITFLSTYEAVRHLLVIASSDSINPFNSSTYIPNERVELVSGLTNRQRAFIAGGVASLLAQTIVVPIDVVSQQLQMKAVYDHARMPEGIKSSTPRFTNIHSVVTGLVRQRGLRGLYKGFFVSAGIYSPTSAIWWSSYDFFCDILSLNAPCWYPRLSLQCMAATLSGCITSILTTPFDAIRARMQVENTRFVETGIRLLREERGAILMKALTPRLIQSITASFFVILGYESIKRFSLLPQYQHCIIW